MSFHRTLETSVSVELLQNISSYGSGPVGVSCSGNLLIAALHALGCIINSSPSGGYQVINRQFNGELSLERFPGL